MMKAPGSQMHQAQRQAGRTAPAAPCRAPAVRVARTKQQCQSAASDATPSTSQPTAHTLSQLVQAQGSMGSSRRAALLGGLMAASAWSSGMAAQAEEGSVQVVDPAPAVEAVPVPQPAAAPAPSLKGKMVELYDPTLAYKFEYPVETVSGQPLKMVTTREPEKYSSAAPLSADARQRIVAELLDLQNFVTISVTVGPVSGLLREQQPAQYKPYDVALTVLVDRSTSRLTSGQRTALNDVERAEVDVRDGQRYFVYEHISQVAHMQ